MFGLRHGGQEEGRHLIAAADIAEKLQPCFARHHDVNNQQVKDKSVEELARLAGRTHIGDPERTFLKEAPQ
jgi:hypothetical protein